MYSKTPQSSMNKRPREDSSTERPRKSPYGVFKVEDDAGETKIFKFRVLLPNGTTLELKLSELRNEMPIEEFVGVVKREYFNVAKQRRSLEPKRAINWKYQDLYFTDVHANKMRIKVNFQDFMPNTWHFLWLHDNSLQALWSNGKFERKLIRYEIAIVELHADRITIFDTGPGMDGTDGNLVKWGKMGASLHRSAREKAIGGKPPYLMTKGGIRDPLVDEKENSPHGSFMKVEIFEPKMKIMDINHLRCRLKDIYFPYIQQIDSPYGPEFKTWDDVQVNGEDLVGIRGGEVATTNLHSCNGPNFILQLHFSNSQDTSMLGQSQKVCLEANARLKCVYFPIVKGEESIQRIIEELEADGCGIRESYESFSRVSVRRLGRLLPDTRWTDLAHHHPYTKALKNFGNRAHDSEKGEARVICRPLGLPDDRGCQLLVENGNRTIDIRDSLSLPIRVIDSGKNGSRDLRFERIVRVQAAANVGSWKVTCHKQDPIYTVRVGSCFEPLSIACYDRYNNRILFTSVPKLMVKLVSNSAVLAQVCTTKVDVTADKSTVKLKVFDEYGNHAKEDEEISLSVDGFSFQDGSSILHNGGVMCCVKKVFKNCEAGSQLENIVFEVVNPEGEVDESIHDGEKHGQSHTLSMKSNSFDIDDSVRYSFRHGRCTIRSIPLPHKEGIFSFSAAHSRYPELNLDIEVRVEKTWQGNFSEIGNHEDEGNPIFSPQNSHQENLLSFPHSPALKVPEVVNRSLSPKSSSRCVLPIGYLPSPKTPKLERTNSRNENSDISPIQDLEDDLTNCGMRKLGRDRNIKILNTRRSHLEQHISVLQASIDGDLRNASRTCAKEFIQKQIESKSRSASAVICRLYEEVPFESRPRDILGIVALLGTVESIELSRILAQYLGEDQMRAIVCKNYAAAHCLETTTLHELATKFGKSVSGGYLALCLEDIRPITSEPSTNPQELLPLQKPTLPNGYVPQGFMGYAVNMISIEASHLRWRTKSGHGLRETLFYRLFGELQVYRNRDCMMAAQSCIKNGAVSLDGVVMRGNGLVSLGHWEPDILFPVKDRVHTPQSSKSLQLLERRKKELTELNRQIDEENKALEQDRKNLEMSRDRTERMAASNPELARDAVNSQGLCAIGGYMSPVNDSYKKKGLIHAEHRIAMCNLACQSSDFVMVDPWEASQSTYQRTLTVLSRVKTSLCESGVVSNESLKVMLVCGSDLLESFSIPGFWIREQVKTICRDFGLICIRRGGQDVQSMISKDDILNEYKNNIIVVDEVVPNGISSTGLRDCISRGLSVKYLTADEVIDYIKQNGLYKPE
ncbi:UNVERIFIED_CONTAM: Nicotinamide/nicotinic acid mononucleotide adenylyltransferase [Sesamum radiatum]|uniref:Nicotinamide/nicotinic acid mononucleotide adenylyltransferase 3 n=1 Tax=Sesamum radiatum TaxID=300843 RepID=A0AAW2KDS9_SESRA